MIVSGSASDTMEGSPHRPWEASLPSQHHQTQTLPSIETLTRDVDSRSIDKSTPLSSTLSAPRDSGNWSAHSGILTSSQSSNMPYLNQPTNTSSPVPYTPDNLAHTRPTFSANHSANPSNASGPGDRGSGDFDDSRRGSVDSRIHQGFKNMDLGPTSPYNASANASQSSLVQGLARERGILTNGYRGPRSSTGSGGPLSPSWPRNSESRGFVPGRVAPPILENPKPEVAFGDRPLRGQAYAFPDPDAPTNRPPSTFSRRNSFAESLASSIYSDRSRLPPGQHELPGETHHHSLQHRQVESLRGDPDSPNSATPYSRTPELRVTHKLAERKRRSEMKDCFEQLRAKLPSNQNNKSSKWETLARAIDYINGLETQVKTFRLDSDKQRHRIQDLEHQLKDLAQQVQRLQHGSAYPSQPPMQQSQHAYVHAQPYTNGADNAKEPPRTLPPIINGAMQGVQYGNDERR